jgi:peptidoglycan/xylan/chitin deacetylase (PgdA/CDA1 family)
MSMLSTIALRPLVAAAGLRSRGPALSVLIYHRVLDRPDSLVPWAIDAASFEDQMRMVKACFEVIPLGTAIDLLRAGRLPRRAACVTFDDGYRDNLTVAVPILRRHRLPATVFVATGFLDGGRMWNDTVLEAVRRTQGDVLDLSSIDLGVHRVAAPAERRAALRALLNRLKYLPHAERTRIAERIGGIAGADLPVNLMMSSREVRELADTGIEIGGHTVSHPILAGLDAAQARREMAEGKERLEQIVGKPLRLFAYPNGRPGTDYRPEHVQALKSLGFAGAVSTAPGVARSDRDPYQIPRFTPWDRSATRFALRLAANLSSPDAERV